MFDILVYLVENYFPAGNYPDKETLTSRLSDAGFQGSEIQSALAWLQGLETAGETCKNLPNLNTDGFRVFTDHEVAKISPEARGFLKFMEDADVISEVQRELIIEQIAALPESFVSLDEIKLVVLMVLWNQQQPVDALVFEELLSDSNQQFVH